MAVEINENVLLKSIQRVCKLVKGQEGGEGGKVRDKKTTRLLKMNIPFADLARRN